MAWPVTFTADKPNSEVTLEPFTTFLVIPAGTEFLALEDWISEEDLPNAYFVFGAKNMINKVQWSPTITKSEYYPYIEGEITISKPATATKNFFEKDAAGKYVTAQDIFIAVPMPQMSLDPPTLTELYLFVHSSSDNFARYYVNKTLDVGEQVTIEAGKIYDLSGHLLYGGGPET